MDMLVLLGCAGSWCNLCLTMLIEGSTGTDVKRALTLYDVVSSHCSSFTFCICCTKCWVFSRWCGDWLWTVYNTNLITNTTSTIEKNSTDNHLNSNSVTNKKNNIISIVVPYIHGLGVKLKRTCNTRGIQVHFKDTNTIKTLLTAPIDRSNKLQNSGVIYKFKCPHINCLEEYIGESGRTFGDRLKEHQRAPSPIHHHSNSIGHPVSPECFTIVDREPHGFTRNIKVAMYICVNDPSLNRNLGKYQLPHIWDQVLQDTPALLLK